MIMSKGEELINYQESGEKKGCCNHSVEEEYNFGGGGDDDDRNYGEYEAEEDRTHVVVEEEWSYRVGVLDTERLLL
jgi:hypothetical protein